MSLRPTTAMVLAAGLGKRMRPLTERIPKPLVEVAGRSLLDRCLDVAVAGGIERAVVNVHHLAPLIRTHLARRHDIDIAISDESDRLLDSAGGIVNALPLLGDEPFVVLNADTFWLERGPPALASMAKAWDDGAMDIMLLLAALDDQTGHEAGPDFAMDEAGRLSRAAGSKDGFIYAGAALVHPRIFDGATAGPHSLNHYFDRAIAAGRLHGHILDGHWITVGTMAAIAQADAAVAARTASR